MTFLSLSLSDYSHSRIKCIFQKFHRKSYLLIFCQLYDILYNYRKFRGEVREDHFRQLNLLPGNTYKRNKRSTCIDNIDIVR